MRLHWPKLTLAQGMILAGCCIPILLVIFAFQQSGQRFPFLDDWDGAYPAAIAARDGTLTLTELFRFHNEHSIVFTKLVHAFFAITTRWDLFAALSVNLILGVLLAVLFLRLVFLEFGRETAWAVAIPVFVVCLSLRSWHNWLIAFQSQFWFMLVFFLAAVVVLRSFAPGWKPLLAAAALAICSTFSLGSGILAWPFLFLIIWSSKYRSIAHYMTFLAIGGLTFALYSYLSNSVEIGHASTTLQDFLNSQWPYTFLITLSSPAAVADPTRSDTAQYVFGLILTSAAALALLAANFYLVAKGWLRAKLLRTHALLWIALAGYSLVSVAGVVYARTGFFGGNVTAGLSTRYTALSIIF